MSNEYDKGDCKDRHDKLEKHLEKLEGRMNWFYILAITSLLTMLVNLVKEVIS